MPRISPALPFADPGMVGTVAELANSLRILADAVELCGDNVTDRYMKRLVGCVACLYQALDDNLAARKLLP